MIVPIVLAASLFGGLFNPTYQPIETKTYGEGGWILRVEIDSFTHQTTCQIENNGGRQPDVTVERGAVAFHFRGKLDTYDAWYKVDASPALAWRNLLGTLVASGSLGQVEGLDNSTKGVVRIPVGELASAHSVPIRPTTYVPPKRFDLQSLSTLLASSAALKCQYSPNGRGGHNDS